ncbi:hypothetical protein FLX56_18845 [Synechococcus moorigangaii CMS01]|nr:hypothetical protein [Synechococcus moorigangaii CMS01]
MPQNLLKIQLLDITSLASQKPRSLFLKEDIDQLADTFLKIGGNTHLILVERAGLDEFEVVEGHLEYYAAVRAREIDDAFERINGVILDENNRQLIQAQSSFDHSIHFFQNEKDNHSSQDQVLIANLEKNLAAHFQDQIKFEISRLEKNLSQSLEQKFDGIKILVPRDEDHLDTFNFADFKVLVDKLASAGFTGKRGEKIATAIAKERKKSLFTSFSEITDRVRLANKNNHKAITETSMLKILDAWNKFIDINTIK